MGGYDVGDDVCCLWWIIWIEIFSYYFYIWEWFGGGFEVIYEYVVNIGWLIVENDYVLLVVFGGEVLCDYFVLIVVVCFDLNILGFGCVVGIYGDDEYVFVFGFFYDWFIYGFVEGNENDVFCVGCNILWKLVENELVVYLKFGWFGCLVVDVEFCWCFFEVFVGFNEDWIGW